MRGSPPDGSAAQVNVTELGLASVALARVGSICGRPATSVTGLARRVVGADRSTEHAEKNHYQELANTQDV